VFRFFRKVSKIVAVMAAGLPLFRAASIERELEQTLRMVRCCQQQRKKAARPPASAA